MSIKKSLLASRQASLQMKVLTSAQRQRALLDLAQLIEDNADFLVNENAKDLSEQKNKIAPSLYQRLELSHPKIQQLAEGLRSLAQAKDLVGKIEWRRLLDDGLILEKQTVPIGVLAVIFESRPDVIPQVLSLMLKSGNVGVLKGGKEAYHSNQAFMSLVSQLNQKLEFLHPAWAQLVETREDVAELLRFDDLIDLVIPRGSNQLVRFVMENTKIPVLGHADGICHVYVNDFEDLQKTLDLIVDSKAQYPSACNAMETLLIKESVASELLPPLFEQGKTCGLEPRGCDRTRTLFPELPAVENWSQEYSDLRFSIRLVDNVNQAIQHINEFGSHHTDAIISENKELQELFLQAVDSASVFVNASTRFADGFRYGMGAEVGISTSRLHARGPVGIEGLTIYKYRLMGDGQIVASYSGANPRSFKHLDL